MTNKYTRLEYETRWIREIAGEPNYVGPSFLGWDDGDAKISAIIRECSSGYGFRYVEYGVRTAGDFRWGEYGEMRRLIYSTLAEQGNELAAAALEALGAEDEE